VRVERVLRGAPVAAALAGAVLARDVVVAGERWRKGRRVSRDDLQALAGESRVPGDRGIPILVPEPGELHEDEAALRLAEAVRGGGAPNLASASGLELRGPSESRVDLVAAVAGVVEIRLAALERLNRIDPLEVFTVFDGQAVAPGALVASVKVGPHLVPEDAVAAGQAIARRGGPIVRVRPFRAGLRVGVVVKESIGGAARSRFEAAVRSKVEGLGLELLPIRYVADDVPAVVGAIGELTRGPRGARLLLTAGGGTSDPSDAFFEAVTALGGRLVRHGVPAHPGSMVWLARVAGATLLGLPSCGAYSKATAADLLLPRLAAGQPPNRATVARLAHGGILNRHQRFRFPAYARELEAPDG
jgi:hypothetical protein